jgi:hypothetical protein
VGRQRTCNEVVLSSREKIRRKRNSQQRELRIEMQGFKNLDNY